MSATFTLNRDQVITGALRLLGVLGQGDSPDPIQVQDAAEALNVLVKSWQADGLQLWKVKKYTLALVQGQHEYDTTTDMGIDKPLKVLHCLLHDIPSDTDVLMVTLTREEYDSLSNKNSESAPVQYYYTPGITSGTLFVYPDVSESAALNKQIIITYQSRFDDMLDSDSVIDFPNEWVRALKYGVAVELAYEYGYPTKDRDRLINHAEKIKLDVMSFDQESGSIYFGKRNLWGYDYGK